MSHPGSHLRSASHLVGSAALSGRLWHRVAMKSKLQPPYRWPGEGDPPPWWAVQGWAYVATLWLQQHAWWTRPVVRPLSELTWKVIRFRRRAWQAAQPPPYYPWEHEER